MPYYNYKRYSDAEKAAYYRRKSRVSLNSPYRSLPSNRKRPKSKSTRKSKYDYPGVGRQIGGSVGSFIGNSLVPGVGGVVGNALGSVVGQGAQSLVKRISGFGDYNVTKNSLVYNQDAVPEFSVNNERCTMITHREFIQDIRSGPTLSGSGTLFNSQTFRINPSIAETFPWLSSIADNYEQYVVQGMVFEYKTTSATAVSSTNTALGTVILATQYNSLSNDFTNKQQMENYEFSQSGCPSQSILHPIECDPLQTQCGGIFNMYVPGSTSGDIRLYDIGRFTIATVGQQAANTVLGELWVSYKICALKPRITGVTEAADHWNLDAATVAEALPLGTYTLASLSTSSSSYAQAGAFTTLISNTAFTINPSFFGTICVILNYYLPANATPQTMPTAVLTGPITDLTTTFLGYAANAIFNRVVTNANGLAATSLFFFKCDGGYTNSGVPMTVTFNALSNVETPFNAELIVMAVPPNLNN